MKNAYKLYAESKHVLSILWTPKLGRACMMIIQVCTMMDVTPIMPSKSIIDVLQSHLILTSDYYERVPKPYQILGFDGAGVVEAVGPDSQFFKEGGDDHVYYSGSPVRHGSNAEFQLVDERSVALKPKSLDFVEAAAMPLTVRIPRGDTLCYKRLLGFRRASTSDTCLITPETCLCTYFLFWSK